LVHCCDDGIGSIGPGYERLLRHLAREGTTVYLVEPRGIGETDPLSPGNADPTATMVAEVWIPQHLRMLHTSLAALRAYDLRRALEHVRADTSGASTTLMARGMVAWSAAIATALDGNVGALCLHELRPSIEEFACERTAKIPQAYAIPAILQLADLPQIVQGADVAKLLVLDPVDCLGRAVSEAQWEETYADAWKDAANDLRIVCHSDCLARSGAVSEFVLAAAHE